jgi:hypothetical protein
MLIVAMPGDLQSMSHNGRTHNIQPICKCFTLNKHYTQREYVMLGDLHSMSHNGRTHNIQPICKCFTFKQTLYTERVCYEKNYSKDIRQQSLQTLFSQLPMLSGLFTFTKPMPKSLDHTTIHTT